MRKQPRSVRRHSRRPERLHFDPREARNIARAHGERVKGVRCDMDEAILAAEEKHQTDWWKAYQAQGGKDSEVYDICDGSAEAGGVSSSYDAIQYIADAAERAAAGVPTDALPYVALALLLRAREKP